MSYYWKEDGMERALQPQEGSSIRLQRDDREEIAAIIFIGSASKADVDEKKTRFKDWRTMPSTM